MKIEIWSDFACPYCYIGEKKLEKALEELTLESKVEIAYRSFQLDVNARSHPDEDINELIAHKYNISIEQAKKANDGIVNTAKDIGLEYDFVNLKPSNTGLAHQLVKFAKTKDLEIEVAKKLFAAYFTKGIELGNKDNLVDLATEVGLNKEDVLKVLDKQIYKDEVFKDQDIARELGVSSVPFFVIDNKYAISGAQSVDHFKGALLQATNNES